MNKSKFYNILHLVSERDLDNQGNLQKSMFSLGPTRLPLWVAGLCPLVAFRRDFFFFFFFNAVFLVSRLGEEGDCPVPWTPDAIANHICPDGGGGPQPTGLNLGNFLSEWSERRLLFKWKGIVLQAFDCVRRQNPRTGRKSSEGFFNSIWAPEDIQDRWAIFVLCLPVPVLVDKELLF